MSEISEAENNKPFRIATIAYSPGEEYPWTLIRLGQTAEQGGFSFGTSRSDFLTLEDALEHLKESVDRDREVIEEVIQDARKWR